MRIAVFDHRVAAANPTGSVMLTLLRGLAPEHEFVVFSTAFENPDPARIRYVPVRVPTRPLALLYLAFHAAARARCALEARRHGRPFDRTLTADSNVTGADLVHAHFGHRAFLRRHWRECGARGLRGRLRWLDHRLHAAFEPRVFSRARRIVAASQGLAGELTELYPTCSGKIQAVPNPIALARMAPPAEFARREARRDLGCDDGDLLLAFVAPGQWERKGLPLLLEAVAGLRGLPVRLVVVGGVEDYVADYRRRARGTSVEDLVRFVGMQRDVRPYLWAADALVLPSAYEVFPLVCMEAAAAALPVVVTPVYGAEEYLRDGASAIVVERSAAGVRAGIERLAAMSAAERAVLGEEARRQVSQYTPDRFLAAWRRIIEA